MRLTLRLTAAAALSLLSGLCAREARALPTAPTALCQARPQIPACQGAVPACSFCHDSTDPPRWNAYGTELKALTSGASDFAAALESALASVDRADSDGDGTSNADELRTGRLPGLADGRAPEQSGATQPNPRYDVGRYDYRFAYRRVSVLYCGRSPSYDELAGFAQDAANEAARRERLHAKLSECLNGGYWRTEGLARLGDKRIRPLTAAGPDSKIQIAGKRLVIGDYNYDYRLFRYALSDDHDMRELLTATYHVQEDAQGKLTQVRGELKKPDSTAIAGGQPLAEQYRAGMLTTQWFLSYFTMFSAMPRTSAAQAYRAYLGADIAASEGLRPVAGEPLDVDAKGVAQERCATCHSTLDPLSYAFADYEGINVSIDLRFGDYMPERTSRIPKWDRARQKSELLGKPVANLVEWAKVAAESQEFRRTMVDMFLHHALGRSALPDEQAAFLQICQSLVQDGHSANRLLHRLIDLPSFGRP